MHAGRRSCAALLLKRGPHSFSPAASRIGLILGSRTDTHFVVSFCCQYGWRSSGYASMRLLSFIYRVISNFAFLALAYFSLNYIEKYNHRAILAILILVYAVMRAVSALRSFYFFSRIERLEVEARRLVG